jgi:GWxTD domain-containing protein
MATLGRAFRPSSGSRFRNRLLAPALLTAWLGAFCLAQTGDDRRLRQEEERSYYDRWLNEDVLYIVTDEERTVFAALTTDEERENFIEQFWRRRDPDMRTAHNEFREEHYRRIAYANEHFTSGRAGWKTDRGRIYIIHGPPHELQDHFGGPYSRPLYEGGGETTTYPYQVWRYRRIDGIGSDIELEFVDTTLTGDYRLAKDPFEKDALANVPGIGLTLAEERGLATKHDRFIRSGAGEHYPLLAQRYQDQPFVRLERYARVMRPPAIRYDDLKQLVDVDVTFNTLPFRINQTHFRLNEDHCIIPITVEFANRHLTFQEEGGVHRARIALYGVVTSMGNLVVNEFEDDVAVAFRPEDLEGGLQGTSLYQKILVLEKGRRVKLDLVAKDTGSGKVGVVNRALVPRNYSAEDLEVSSLVLSDMIVPLTTIPDSDEMFVLGDVKVRPSLDRRFPLDRLMGVYFQLYNFGVDQQSFQPSLRVTYRLLRGDTELLSVVDDTGESIQFFSVRRVVMTRMFSPQALGVGRYRITVEVRDQITNQMAMLSEEFEIVPPRRGPSDGS